MTMTRMVKPVSTPGINEFDADLQKTVRRTSYMRQLFYCVVLLVALAGQVSGAVEALGIPVIWAIPAVGALELGGIVVLANADVRRRLGEKATGSRILSVLIAAWAVAFNWLAHDNKLLAGFFAGMSALGYLVWLMHTENQRRDRLRAKGDLPPTTPAYELVGHWLRHPWMTLRAQNLAKANPNLGLYSSIAAAKAEKRKEQRTAAIAKVLHRKIRAAVDPTTADIALAVYDVDEIAVRLADGADYDGLTALIEADLTPGQLAIQLQTLTSARPMQHELVLSEPDLDPPVAAETFAQFSAGVDERLANLTAAVADRDATIDALHGELKGVHEELSGVRRAIAQGGTAQPDVAPRERRTVVARSEPTRASTRRVPEKKTPAPMSDADRFAVVEAVMAANPGLTATKLDPLIGKALGASDRTGRRAREDWQRAQAAVSADDAPSTAAVVARPDQDATAAIPESKPAGHDDQTTGAPDQRSPLRLVEKVA